MSVGVRLLTAGADALSDLEIIELLLESMLPKKDTKGVAKRLIQRFGCLADIVEAPISRLCSVGGIDLKAASHLKMVKAVAVKLVKSELDNRPLLENWIGLVHYLNATLSRTEVEQFKVLFLNRRNTLLADELFAQGTVDHVPVYPREVVKRALELNATAVILVHNHPGGDPSPSGEDIRMTVQIMGALKTVGIVVHDHIIIGKGAIVSFRQSSTIPFAAIDPAAPYCRATMAEKKIWRAAAG
jgi:DNA repair protein RadC